MQEQRREADVLVVGSGAAGLMAAIEAADAGASVSVVESEAEIGGSTRLSGAYVVLCETPLQPGARDELLEDLLESHHGDCQQDLSRLYVEESAATFRRLEAHGLRFARTFQFAHMRKPWAHEFSGEEMGGGAEIVMRLGAAARARDIQIATSTRARRLLLDDGRVVGLRAERSGTDVRYRAGAVVVASGGFTRNAELIRNFGRPGAENILPLTGPGSRGDGLLMGMAAGAGVSYMTLGVAPTSPADPETGKGVMVLYAGAIAVNRRGERFCRESELYVDTCWAALQQPDAAFAQIYDHAMRETYAGTMMGKVLTGFREIQAPTIEELAGRLGDEFGFDEAGIASTVARYNRQLAHGGDEDFQRAYLVGGSGEAPAIAQPPFYAALCRPGTTHFNGGLTVDASMNVRGVFGDAIPGLYAAGEVTGGFHGAGYMSGTFMGMALIFGGVAGRSAAGAA
jgi:fumarate reductase flavoprotein subunit